MFNEIFKFFSENDLISSNQSSFKPCGYYVNHQVSITREVYKSFDEHYEVRGAILHFSKAFDSTWDDGIIFKVAQI